LTQVQTRPGFIAEC